MDPKTDTLTTDLDAITKLVDVHLKDEMSQVATAIYARLTRIRWTLAQVGLHE